MDNGDSLQHGFDGGNPVRDSIRIASGRELDEEVGKGVKSTFDSTRYPQGYPFRHAR